MESEYSSTKVTILLSREKISNMHFARYSSDISGESTYIFSVLSGS